MACGMSFIICIADGAAVGFVEASDEFLINSNGQYSFLLKLIRAVSAAFDNFKAFIFV
jgi:hypothetical protein